MSRQAQAYLYAGCAVLCWSTVASAFKVSLRYVDVPHLLLYATLVSTAVLLIAAAWQGKLGQAFSCTPKEYLRSAALGFLNPFLYYLVLFESYDRLPAQEAQPLNYTWPMVVVILSVPFLKQPIGRVSLAGIVVSFFGVLVISTRGDLLSFRFSDPVGTALAVGSAFIWATFWLSNVRDDRDEVVKLLLNFAFGLPFVCVAAFALAGAPPLDPARHRGFGVRGGLRDGGDVPAVDAGAVALADDGAGEQPGVPVAVPVARADKRDRRGEDTGVVGDRAGVHHRRASSSGSSTGRRSRLPEGI